MTASQSGGTGRQPLEDYLLRAEWDQNGFPTKADNTISFNDGNLTFSIQPTATDFDFYVEGVEFTSTGDTIIIADTLGIHAIYYDNTGTIQEIVNPAMAQIDDLILNKCLICILYWNVSDAEAIYVGEERHGKAMAPPTHAYLHSINGLAYLFGLGLNTLDVDGSGDDTTAAQFGVDAGGVTDEDLYASISAVVSTKGLPIYHMIGSTPERKRTVKAGFPVRTYDNTSSIRLAWNEFTGGSWQLSEVDNNDFVLCHVFATTEKDKPMIAIMGQNEYNTRNAARTGAETEIHSLILNDVLFPEIRPIATLIFQTSNGYDNDVKGRVVSTDDGADYIDWRNETITRTATSTTDHNSLAGLQGGTVGEYYHQTAAQAAAHGRVVTVGTSGADYTNFDDAINALNGDGGGTIHLLTDVTIVCENSNKDL